MLLVGWILYTTMYWQQATVDIWYIWLGSEPIWAAKLSNNETQAPCTQIGNHLTEDQWCRVLKFLLLSAKHRVELLMIWDAMTLMTHHCSGWWPKCIETVSAGGRSVRPARLGVHPIWWRWHGNTNSLSKVQSCDVKCMLTSQSDFSLRFNCSYWRENTSMNIVWYMIMAFAWWSKQHRMVT